MVIADEFRAALSSEIDRAQRNGQSFIEINAGKLHRSVGGYPAAPGANHSMPNCCQVMKGEMLAGDCIISAPPKGQGASLTIRYNLPRRREKT